MSRKPKLPKLRPAGTTAWDICPKCQQRRWVIMGEVFPHPDRKGKNWEACWS